MQFFYKTLLLASLLLVLIASPLVVFSIQHMISKENNLYTYLDSSSTKVGEPISLIIQNRNIREVVSVLEVEGWRTVPTFSASDPNTWQFSIQKGSTPISKRFFNEKEQSVSLEGPNSTLRKRNHVRFWVENNTIYGAASYDSDVTLSFNTVIPIPTHKINSDIDFERDLLGKMLAKSLDMSISYKDNTFPFLYKTNNSGSWYYTDGEVLLLKKQQEAKGNRALFLRRVYFQIIMFPYRDKTIKYLSV